MLSDTEFEQNLFWKTVKCTWMEQTENLTSPYSLIFHHQLKGYTSSEVGETGENSTTNLPKQPIHLKNFKRFNFNVIPSKHNLPTLISVKNM